MKQLRRVYDANDWKNADRMERLMIHLVDGDIFPLNNQDHVYLSRLRECFTIMKSNFSEVSIAKQLKYHFPTMNVTEINRLKRDCNKFYDHFSIETKKLNWMKQYERIMKHLEKCYENDDMKPVASLESTLQKMRAEMPEELVEVEEDFIPDFEFTTDDKYLDIGYEEVKDEEE